MNKFDKMPAYKAVKYISKNDNGLMVLKNASKFRNRSYVASKGRIQTYKNGSLMNISKHRAGSKPAKKPKHNQSFNIDYGSRSALEIADYSSSYN